MIPAPPTCCAAAARAPRRLLGLASMALLIASRAAAGDDPLPPGVYRLEMRMAARTAVPLVGAAATATVSLARVEIQRDGGGWRQTHRVCGVRFEGGLPLVRMRMPERFVSALATPSYPLELTPAAEGWRYRADLGVETVGFQPTVGTPALPAAATDPRVYDWDGDGHPGATLHLSIAGLADGELYVVQRGHSVLEGAVTARGQAAGHIEVRVFQQAVLAAAPAFLARDPDIVPVPSQSAFHLTRVPDGTGCAALAAAPYAPDPGPVASPFGASQ